MFKNVASQKLIVFAFNATNNLPTSGDAANITAYVSKDYGAVTVLGDTSATEMDATNAKGYYLFDLTQAETNGDTLLFSAKSSTANIVVVGVPATVFTFPASFTSFTAPLDAAAVRTAVGLASANLDTQLGTIDDFLDTEMAAVLAAVDTEVAAIKAKTDLIPGTQDGLTFAQQMILMASVLLGKTSGMDTATGTIRAADDSKTRVTVTQAAAGRSALTLDAT